MQRWLAACVLGLGLATQAGAQIGPATQPYADARSTASDEEVRGARRAYRAACQTRHSEAYCECMTGGMAQALVPTDLAIATAEFSGQSVPASEPARARVASMRSEIDRGCAQFRGSPSD